MNTERILALADLIEPLQHVESLNAQSGFSMLGYAHKCGTPACIAGWAKWEMEGRPEQIEDTMDVSDEAQVYLGLSDEKAYRLFMPAESWWKITPAHAAATLRHLAETGEVDWEAGARKAGS